MRTITPLYAAEQRRLHATDPTFGVQGYLWAYHVAGIATIEDCRSVLDYGCGKGTLGEELRRNTRLAVEEYDPGIPGKDGLPLSCDLVVSLDVLEHIEPFCLEAVLNDLKMLTRKCLFVVISTKLSKRIMADGRDTHLIVRNPEDWTKTFVDAGFKIKRTWDTDRRLWIALMVK